MPAVHSVAGACSISTRVCSTAVLVHFICCPSSIKQSFVSDLCPQREGRTHFTAFLVGNPFTTTLERCASLARPGVQISDSVVIQAQRPLKKQVAAGGGSNLPIAGASPERMSNILSSVQAALKPAPNNHGNVEFWHAPERAGWLMKQGRHALHLWYTSAGPAAVPLGTSLSTPLCQSTIWPRLLALNSGQM